MKTYPVESQHDGQRIDAVLPEIIDAYSRTFAQKLIREGLVRINQSPAKKGQRVKIGDQIVIREPSLKPSKFSPEDIPLQILHEDDDLIVVNKPAGLITHPSSREQQHTLVNALLHHCGKRLSGIGGELRPGIVHRLDKNTSGIMVVAKHDACHRDLAKQIQERRVEKHYLTLVDGIMKTKEGTIEAPLLKTQIRGKNKVIVSSGKDSKDSTTHFSLQEVFRDQYSLLKVQIITGRMHQIRVHLAAIHHPVVGDEVYGNEKVNRHFESLGLHRQFLHAFQLRFQHPRTHEWVSFEAPLPEDLESILLTLGSME